MWSRTFTRNTRRFSINDTKNRDPRKVLTGEAIRLDVPFYRQHYDFTCGPASLIMVMKYFDKKLRPSKEVEMDIWRESNMVESYGSSRYGLAFAAEKRGFRVNLYSNMRGAGFVRKIEDKIGKVDYRTLSLHLQERRRRSLELGAKEASIRGLTEKMLRENLKAKFIPILLSNAEYFNSEDVPHWIVVCGIDARKFYVNNPLDRRGPRDISLDMIDLVIGYKGDQCMVAVSAED